MNRVRNHDCANRHEIFRISTLTAFHLNSLQLEVNADRAGEKHAILPDVMTGVYHTYTQTHEHIHSRVSITCGDIT